MNKRQYLRLIDITNILSNDKTPAPVFERNVNQLLNDCKVNKLLEVRLKNAENKDDNKRGLKVCTKKQSVLNQYALRSGDIVLKFNPLIRVFNFSCKNCSECGIELNDIGTKNICKNCGVRAWCSDECRVKCVMDSHGLECDFLKFLHKEVNLFGKNKGEATLAISEAIEKNCLVILTVFKLLLKMSRCEEIYLSILSNMSDHLKLFKKWNKDNESVSEEHQSLFNMTKNKYTKIFENYFEEKKRSLKIKKTGMGINGIYRAFFLIYINATTMQNTFGDDVGFMFDPIFAMINHSCNPNCTLIWKNEDQLLLKVLNNIKPAEELFINYCPINMPEELRQKTLMRNFFFNCECEGCSEVDKKLDKWIPIDCISCGWNISGFILENFETGGYAPKHLRKEMICQNCDRIIPVNLIYKQYRKIFDYFKKINKCARIEELFDFAIQNDLVNCFDNRQTQQLIKLFKESYALVPVRAWPMYKIICILKELPIFKETESLYNIRFSILSNYVGENLIEDSHGFKNLLGSSLYETAVHTLNYLLSIYKTGLTTESEKNNFLTITRGCFALSIIAYKHLAYKFGDTDQPPMKDLLNIAKEANMLIRLKDESLCIKVLSYRNLDDFLNKFVQLLECGPSFGFQDLIPLLDSRDSEIFNVEIEYDNSESPELIKLDSETESDDMVLQCRNDLELLGIIRETYTPLWVINLANVAN